MIEFIPDRRLADALAQARGDAQAWEMLRNRGADKQTQWADWAGNELEAMMRLPDRTVLHLTSAIVPLRLAAVALVVYYWPPRESFAGPCLQLAFDDQEPAIRGGALRGLLSLQTYISDGRGWLTNLLNSLYGALSDQHVTSAQRTLVEGRASIKQFECDTMKKLAGAQLDNILQSRAAAESFLRNPDPQLRRAALFALGHNWEVTRDLADQCEILLFADPDTKVRLGALANIGAFYHESDDRRIGDMLARMVYDAAQPNDLRIHAYRLLFHVRGMPLAVKEKAWSLEFSFPDEVDWVFVDSFLREVSWGQAVNNE